MTDISFYGPKTSIISNKQPIALTIGNFDGVHLGHQQVLQRLRDLAGPDLPCVVLIFDPCPAAFFQPEKKCLLSTPQEKIELLLAHGADVVCVAPFHAAFAALTAEAFIKEWLPQHFQINALLVGHDFRFGVGRAGDVHLLKQLLSCPVEHIQPFEIKKGLIEWKSHNDCVTVSSTLIRHCLKLGNVVMAQKALGRPYRLSGTVVRGDERGRLLGFPTANMKLNDLLIKPRLGVYACVAHLQNGTSYHAIVNYGRRPSVSTQLEEKMEAHLLNFEGDLYQQILALDFISFIRDEQKFNGLGELKDAIAQDKLWAERFFASH